MDDNALNDTREKKKENNTNKKTTDGWRLLEFKGTSSSIACGWRVLENYLAVTWMGRAAPLGLFPTVPSLFVHLQLRNGRFHVFHLMPRGGLSIVLLAFLPLFALACFCRRGGGLMAGEARTEGGFVYCSGLGHLPLRSPPPCRGGECPDRLVVDDSLDSGRSRSLHAVDAQRLLLSQ